MKRRAPRGAGDAILALADQIAPLTPLSEIQRAWKMVAGDAIARNAQPTAERAGTVTITCASSVWAQELDLLSPDLIERLNDALSACSVTSLRCQAAPARSWPGDSR